MRAAGSKTWTLRSERSVERAKAGFSLPELVVALAVLAVVALFAIPAYFDRAEVTLENAAVLLAQDLKGAQNRAAIWGKRLEVRFHRDGYVVVDESGVTVDGPMSQPFVRNYRKDAVFEGVWVEAAGFGGDSSLEYAAGGETRESGTVILRYAGARRELRVARRTGRVEIDGSTSGFVDG